MVLYFSGTGNSRWAALRIAELTGDRAVSLNELLKSRSTAAIEVNGPLIVVTPTYAWRLPRIVENFLNSVELKGVEKAWFVMSCGSDIGNALKYIKKLCACKEFECMGVLQIVMPENYIAMFDVPDEEEEAAIMKKAEQTVTEAAALITSGKPFPAPRAGILADLKSGVVNTGFYKYSVSDKAFTAGDACVGCGKCVSLCPLNNIVLKDGKPVWNGICTHCMACISRCPAEAIEYGRKSVGKRRYFRAE